MCIVNIIFALVYYSVSFSCFVFQPGFSVKTLFSLQLNRACMLSFLPFLHKKIFPSLFSFLIFFLCCAQCIFPTVKKSSVVCISFLTFVSLLCFYSQKVWFIDLVVSPIGNISACAYGIKTWNTIYLSL